MRKADGAGLRGRGPDADRGSAPVEFLLVAIVLTVLTLGVIQLAAAVYVRNVMHDAVVDGAYRAALADARPGDGTARARDLIRRAVGAAYADDVRETRRERGGAAFVEVAARAPFPVIGFVGVGTALEVTGAAPVESFE